MKLTRNSILAAGSLIVGGFIGASTLVAFAGTWTAAPATPPNNNVDAPINVGSAFQYKTGKLGLGSLINYSNEANRPLLDVNGTGMFTNLGVTGNLIVSAGASTTPGAVLTNVNGDGIAKWSTIAGGSGSSFGVWNDINNDGSPDTVSFDTVYKAQTDGIVIAYISTDTTNPSLTGYTDSSSNPTTIVAQISAAPSSATMSFPVRKGDYWKVAYTVADGVTKKLSWMPITH